MKKRYQYWASENGKPIKKWTDFFEWDDDYCPRVQLKGYKGDLLLCEYDVSEVSDTSS